jgi:gas vesicle protein
MSQQDDNFLGGFILGTIVGGVVGGIAGVLVSSRLSQSEGVDAEGLKKLDSKVNKKRNLKQPTEQTIEVARRGLEDKIAQLNDAIDDVRQQLGAVNGSAAIEGSEHPISKDL